MMFDGYVICLYCLIGVIIYVILQRTGEAMAGPLRTTIAELLTHTFLISVLCLLLMIAARLKMR